MVNNPKYLPNKKNGGNPPPVNDPRIKYVPIGCKECKECRDQKQREWQCRLQEDIKVNTNGKFVAFTFSNESIKKLNSEIPNIKSRIRRDGKTTEEEIIGYKRDNAIATLAMRRFLERYRKKYGKSLRHWAVTELGQRNTENIHIHAIIWTNEKLGDIEQIWKYGFMFKGTKIQIGGGKFIYENYVNMRSINYIVKYFSKIDKLHKTYQPIILTSDGIGMNYTDEQYEDRCEWWTFRHPKSGKWSVRIYTYKKLRNKQSGDQLKNKYNANKTNETYRTSSGHKISLPIYWRNKIYTEEQREQLWIIKLDRAERWVLGQRIDVSSNEIEYYRALDSARRKNKDLGYGDGKINWKRQEYEKQRRVIMLHQRTRAA